MDSTISGVNPSSSILERTFNPSLRDVSHCAPAWANQFLLLGAQALLKSKPFPVPNGALGQYLLLPALLFSLSRGRNRGSRADILRILAELAESEKNKGDATRHKAYSAAVTAIAAYPGEISSGAAAKARPTSV